MYDLVFRIPQALQDKASFGGSGAAPSCIVLAAASTTDCLWKDSYLVRLIFNDSYIMTVHDSYI